MDGADGAISRLLTRKFNTWRESIRDALKRRLSGGDP